MNYYKMLKVVCNMTRGTKKNIFSKVTNEGVDVPKFA